MSQSVIQPLKKAIVNSVWLWFDCEKELGSFSNAFI